jgi:histidinol-phosphate aminotransferase
MEMGGSWSVYWYNGLIVSSEIARGLDIFELVPSEHLSQNEIDAAKSVRSSSSTRRGSRASPGRRRSRWRARTSTSSSARRACGSSPPPSARAAQLCGARLLRGMAMPPDYRIDAEAIADGVQRHRPKLAFVCAPNNPTGQAFAREELRAVADACRRAGTLLVLDQSFEAFPAEPLGTPALPGHPAVLHLRSLTQDHALAGVRAAFAIGPAAVVAAINRARAPWLASTHAQAAAVAALSAEGEEHLARTLPRLRYQRERMTQWLSERGIGCVPSSTHFFLVAVGSAEATAERLRREHGIGVRDCGSFGLPQHIRVAARTSEENDTLLSALAEVRAG